MRTILSGCLKLFLAPILLGVLLLAVIGAGVSYLWAVRHLFEPAPLVMEKPELGLLRDKLLQYQLKSVRSALNEQQNGRFELKLDEKELSALVDSNLPPWLGEKFSEVTLDPDDQLNFRLSRKWREGKWLNLEARAVVAAEQGNFTVQLRTLRLGACHCPALALAQLSHLVEVVLEQNPSLRGKPWRIREFHQERGRVRLSVETWPR